MVTCLNRMPKCCIIGMHTICCVTHTEASSTCRQCGLADHNVVESINKLQVLSFLLYFTSRLTAS